LTLGLIVCAAILRFVSLDQIPPGLHNDEAATGIDAKRILERAVIGPYSRGIWNPDRIGPFGQPTGPIYFAAPFVALLGETVFAIRLAMAALGVASVAAVFLTLRAMFGRPIAFLAALLLCVSVWHLHFSRTAFLIISWPLLEMVVLGLFYVARRSGRLLHYALTGLALGAGVYTYNAYPVFVLAFGMFVVWIALRSDRQQLGTFTRQVALMALCAFVAALPLIFYAADSNNRYFEHPQNLSITEASQWKEGTLADRADVILDSVRHVYTDTFWRGAPDYSDGAGQTAMVDHVSLVLLAAGVIVALLHWRQPQYLCLLIMLTVLPLTSVFTVGYGSYRREFGLIPFIATLQALPLAWLWGRAAGSASAVQRFGSGAIVVLISAIIAFLNLNFYFREFPVSAATRYIFQTELTDASRYMNTLPNSTYVYYYDNRLTFDNDTRLYLAGGLNGEDRAREHTPLHTLSIALEHEPPVLFVFIGNYLGLADEVEKLYPGGLRHDEFTSDGRHQFSSYLLPAGATQAPPDNPTPISTPTRDALPGGEERDLARLDDMHRLRQALNAYFQQYGEYPTNGGAIQTLCSSRTSDAGCRLSEVLSPLPRDPSGSQDQGYFYSSNGSTYALYAYRETETVPSCADHPERLARLASVMCIHGP
jgi:4-amino-4-deoxy-L-arabinose transferase-like glycosyltransferase